MKDTTKELPCGICGELFDLGQLEDFDERLLCVSCLERETLFCEDCGSRIWRRGDYGNSDYHLCEDCYHNHYLRCERCGHVIPQDEARYHRHSDVPYCEDCFEEESDPIEEYTYKPDPIFYGDGMRYLGVELEIDGGGKEGYKAEQLLEIGNFADEHIYMKHDGSLNNGFEIVTHPMTLDYHKEQMPWQSLMRRAAALGYLSHNATTCGLHVHVSREAFGETEAEQDARIARILYFFERYWEELLKFSRRTPRQLERWAARYGYKDHPQDILEHAKKGYNGGRYTSINLQNAETIEFRVFRGTLKYNSLFATLQLVDHLCDVALFLSDEEIKALSWTSFVEHLRPEKYPELIAYMKERRLYINEAVECEDEL